jgi:hypothetical protein
MHQMPKTALITLSHKQSEHISEMASAIASLSPQPFKAYVVCDRPSGSERIKIRQACEGKNIDIISVSETPEYMFRPNILIGTEPFLAGHCRNIGISKAIEDGCDSFVFIDGDCIPGTNLVGAHQEVHDYSAPILTIGRRVEQKHNWKDQREVTPNTASQHIFSENPLVLTTYKALIQSGFVWSCNLGMNLKAVELLQKTNEFYFGRKEVFSGQFTGTWGAEDGFLGVEAFMMGARLVSISTKDSYVKHKEHDRPQHKYDQVRFDSYLRENIALMEYLSANNPLPLKNVL